MTSVQPAFVRWYRTLAPTTPPPMTTTWVCCFTRSPRTDQTCPTPYWTSGTPTVRHAAARRWSSVATPRSRTPANAPGCGRLRSSHIAVRRTRCRSLGLASLALPSLVVRGNATLGDPALDERVEFLAHGRIHRRRLVRLEQILPESVRLRGQLGRAGLLPRFVVA